jgi:hypothetical protein
VFTLTKIRKLRSLASIVLPVVGGYWLYTYAFTRIGGLLGLGVLVALFLAWRLNLRRESRRAKTRMPSSHKPEPQLEPTMANDGACVALGGWD